MSGFDTFFSPDGPIARKAAIRSGSGARLQAPLSPDAGIVGRVRTYDKSSKIALLELPGDRLVSVTNTLFPRLDPDDKVVVWGVSTRTPTLEKFTWREVVGACPPLPSGTNLGDPVIGGVGSIVLFEVERAVDGGLEGRTGGTLAVVRPGDLGSVMYTTDPPGIEWVGRAVEARVVDTRSRPIVLSLRRPSQHGVPGPWLLGLSALQERGVKTIRGSILASASGGMVVVLVCGLRIPVAETDLAWRRTDRQPKGIVELFFDVNPECETFHLRGRDTADEAWLMEVEDYPVGMPVAGVPLFPSPEGLVVSIGYPTSRLNATGLVPVGKFGGGSDLRHLPSQGPDRCPLDLVVEGHLESRGWLLLAVRPGRGADDIYRPAPGTLIPVELVREQNRTGLRWGLGRVEPTPMGQDTVLSEFGWGLVKDVDPKTNRVQFERLSPRRPVRPASPATQGTASANTGHAADTASATVEDTDPASATRELGITQICWTVRGPIAELACVPEIDSKLVWRLEPPAASEPVQEAATKNTAPTVVPIILRGGTPEPSARFKVGAVVEGVVRTKVDGGLLVDIGVSAFLPASQVDTRKPNDIADFIGTRIRAKIVSVSEDPLKIVISRRELLQQELAFSRTQRLSTLTVGQVETGTVQNIETFGAFVEVGGVVGLLHISELSWSRITHPGEVLQVGQEVEVMIVKIDPDTSRLELSLRQKGPSPWDRIEERIPVGSRVSGTVVQLMTYGAFVRLGEGIEGLLHITQMSWTRRIRHPAELVTLGQQIETVVISLDAEKHELGLGLKQTVPNPWGGIVERYPIGSKVSGDVRVLSPRGAYVEIEKELDGFLEVSEISWTKKLSVPSELLALGEHLRCEVISTDAARSEIRLSLKRAKPDPWVNDIPSHYKPGCVVMGLVSKVVNFGVFVELERDLDGLVHHSELPDRGVSDPMQVVTPGQRAAVKILRVDLANRKISLSMKAVLQNDVVLPLRFGAEAPPDRTFAPPPAEATTLGVLCARWSIKRALMMELWSEVFPTVPPPDFTSGVLTEPQVQLLATTSEARGMRAATPPQASGSVAREESRTLARLSAGWGLDRSQLEAAWLTAFPAAPAPDFEHAGLSEDQVQALEAALASLRMSPADRASPSATHDRSRTASDTGELVEDLLQKRIADDLQPGLEAWISGSLQDSDVLVERLKRFGCSLLGEWVEVSRWSLPGSSGPNSIGIAVVPTAEVIERSLARAVAARSTPADVAQLADVLPPSCVLEGRYGLKGWLGTVMEGRTGDLDVGFALASSRALRRECKWIEADRLLLDTQERTRNEALSAERADLLVMFDRWILQRECFGERLRRSSSSAPLAGGFSLVVPAEDAASGQKFAVKCLRPGARTVLEHVSRLRLWEGEARLLESLAPHPNIVRGFPRLSRHEHLMEWIEGLTLDRWLQTSPTLQARLELLPVLGRGIVGAFLHLVSNTTIHFVHNDLSPRNVIVVASTQNASGAGDVKLIDFGLATQTDSAESRSLFGQTGAAVVADPYRHPHLRLAKIRPCQRTDIYSLGMMLAELVLGQPPAKVSGVGDLESAGPWAQPIYRCLSDADTLTTWSEFADSIRSLGLMHSA